MTRNRLTEEEEQYLIESYQNINIEVDEIAFALDTDEQHIHKWANYRGLKRPKAPLGHKICKKCKQVLPFTKFHMNVSNKSGVTSWCRSCSNEYRKELRKTQTTKTKICNVCNTEKPIAEFQKRQGACSDCLHHKRKIESNLGRYNFDEIINKKLKG